MTRDWLALLFLYLSLCLNRPILERQQHIIGVAVYHIILIFLHNRFIFAVYEARRALSARGVLSPHPRHGGLVAAFVAKRMSRTLQRT